MKFPRKKNKRVLCVQNGVRDSRHKLLLISWSHCCRFVQSQIVTFLKFVIKSVLIKLSWLNLQNIYNLFIYLFIY